MVILGERLQTLSGRDASATRRRTSAADSSYQAKGTFMKRVHQLLVAGFAALCLGLVSGAVLAADIHTKAPENFKKVSTLVKLPDYLPGLGVLYVDPSTLPVGPFLGYDKKGHLVNVTY